MTNSTPQDMLLPGEMFETEQNMPTEIPPKEMPAGTTLAQAEPTETPPSEVVAGASGTSAAVWHTGKKITGLWSINQNRNACIAVSGMSWKQLANNSDSAIVALTMLSCHAKDKGSNVNLYEDSGQIKEMYVW